MSSPYKKICYLYPTALDDDFLLRDKSDGNGAFLVYWNTAKLGVQPTMTVINAVNDNDADATYDNKVKEEKFNRDIIKAVGLTMKDFMNEIMAGRTTPLTNAELKTKFKSHL